MTSKNSFLVSGKENNKRRIWVWAVSILGQLVLYPGILEIYLSRINFQNAEGTFKLPEHYTAALQEAAADALGFQPLMKFPVALLGILIAVQGFSYLYDRKKVDMYHSVPVSAKRRFVIVYLNGILTYALPALASLLIGILLASVQGVMTGRCMTECWLALLLNLLYFLVVYHTTILAVMLTGNVIITGFATVILLSIVYVAYFVLAALKVTFFATATSFLMDESFTGSVIVAYDFHIYRLKRAALLSEVITEILPIYGKWFVLALFLLALSYLAYRKRPAEAAGRAIAFQQIKPIVKIIVSVVAGLIICWFVYDATYYNVAFTAFSIIGGTVLCGIVMEAIYEADIRGAFKHLVSTGIGAVLAALIFCIFQFDLFGYDSYVPKAGEIESFALDIGPYQSYWEWREEDVSFRHISDDVYIRDNMFLTDAEAVCELAGKGLALQEIQRTEGLKRDDMDVRSVRVLYRLQSGREVCRNLLVDFADASNEELLNRLIGTQAFRDGFYLMENDAVEAPLNELEREWQLSYTNGTIETQLPASESLRLREMWLKDMEQFDFTLARNNRPCGKLVWQVRNDYIEMQLPVYESFTNTLAFLEAYQAYYPMQLRAEDVLSLEITNWHNQEQNEYVYTDDTYGVAAVDTAQHSVTKEFTDSEEIAEIVKHIYPSGMRPSLYWNEGSRYYDEYTIVITFKSDTEYPYRREYFNYGFIKGQVPDFVVERTAFQAEK